MIIWHDGAYRVSATVSADHVDFKAYKGTQRLYLWSDFEYGSYYVRGYRNPGRFFCRRSIEDAGMQAIDRVQAEKRRQEECEARARDLKGRVQAFAEVQKIASAI